MKKTFKKIIEENDFSSLAKSFSLNVSKPFLPNNANMFFLYSSTPGWSNGLTPNK